MRRIARVAIGCLNLAVACAPNLGTATIAGGHLARFRDIPVLILADSGEVRPIPGTGYLRYPEQERTKSIEAALVVAFVVDTAGRAEYETVSFIGGAPPAFLNEACLWLRSQRFTPVQRDGTVRRALVVTDLTFTLQPGPMGDVHLVNRAPPVNAERRRRDFAAKGVVAAAHELEAHRHC
jgi:hypothetical protein